MAQSPLEQFREAKSRVSNSVEKMLLWENALERLQLAVSDGDVETVRSLVTDKDFVEAVSGGWSEGRQMRFNGVLGLAMYLREEEIIKLMVKAGANPVGPYASYRDDLYYLIGEKHIPRDMLALAVSHSTLSRKMQYAVQVCMPGMYPGHFLNDRSISTGANEVLPAAKAKQPIF